MPPGGQGKAEAVESPASRTNSLERARNVSGSNNAPWPDVRISCGSCSDVACTRAARKARTGGPRGEQFSNGVCRGDDGEITRIMR